MRSGLYDISVLLTKPALCREHWTSCCSAMEIEHVYSLQLFVRLPRVIIRNTRYPNLKAIMLLGQLD